MVNFAKHNEVVLHYDLYKGSEGQRPIVFANSLGTDLRIWDAVRKRLDPSIPVLALDKRGHGLSEMGPISITTLAEDMAYIMDHLSLSGVLICGVSVGGMIAQALAAARPDLVGALMLCNTGAKIGTSETWNARIETVNSEGIDAIADAILERWFAPNWRRANPVALAGWRQMLARTSTEGYAGTCAAIRDADLMHSSRRLTVPTVCVAGSADGATPPDVVKALADIMPNAKYHCIDDTGHLPCIEAPDALSNILIQHYDALA